MPRVNWKRRFDIADTDRQKAHKKCYELEEEIKKLKRKNRDLEHAHERLNSRYENLGDEFNKAKNALPQLDVAQSQIGILFAALELLTQMLRDYRR